VTEVRARRIAAALLVVATSIVVTVAVAGVWARRDALNTDRWVATAGPVGEPPGGAGRAGDLDDD
jgi:hypothetical protein